MVRTYTVKYSPDNHIDLDDSSRKDCHSMTQEVAELAALIWFHTRVSNPYHIGDTELRHNISLSCTGYIDMVILSPYKRMALSISELHCFLHWYGLATVCILLCSTRNNTDHKNKAFFTVCVSFIDILSYILCFMYTVHTMTWWSLVIFSNISLM